MGLIIPKRSNAVMYEFSRKTQRMARDEKRKKHYNERVIGSIIDWIIATIIPSNTDFSPSLYSSSKKHD